jgi:hypothetical protein
VIYCSCLGKPKRVQGNSHARPVNAGASCLSATGRPRAHGASAPSRAGALLGSAGTAARLPRHHLAEREGFEPSVPIRVQRFSRPPRSTAPAPLQMTWAHAHCVVAASTTRERPLNASFGTTWQKGARLPRQVAQKRLWVMRHHEPHAMQVALSEGPHEAKAATALRRVDRMLGGKSDLPRCCDAQC